MKKYYYTFAYLFLLGIPALFVTCITKNFIEWKSLVLVTVITLIIGGIFDIWAVRQNKKDAFFIWEYNKRSIIGIKFFGVPIEDFFLFLILTPIFIISIYEGVKQYLFKGDIVSFFIIVGIIMTVFLYRIIYQYAVKQRRK